MNRHRENRILWSLAFVAILALMLVLARATKGLLW